MKRYLQDMHFIYKYKSIAPLDISIFVEMKKHTIAHLINTNKNSLPISLNNRNNYTEK